MRVNKVALCCSVVNACVFEMVLHKNKVIDGVMQFGGLEWFYIFMILVCVWFSFDNEK